MIHPKLTKAQREAKAVQDNLQHGIVKYFARARNASAKSGGGKGMFAADIYAAALRLVDGKKEYVFLTLNNGKYSFWAIRNPSEPIEEIWIRKRQWVPAHSDGWRKR